MILTISSILLIIFTSEAVDISSYRAKQVIPEDATMDFMGISKKYQHSAVEHTVITEDGYILTLFNIPGNKNKPVLLAHGVFDTSAGFVLTGNNSLGMILANEGFDIWLLNVRGNRYSNKHKTLDRKNITYWDYSFHEMGYYDLAANIDYVLKATGQSQLSIIGFSEGTTMTFVLMSTRPEYNKKVRVFIALAPVVFLSNAVGPLNFLIHAGPFLNFVLPPSFTEVGGFNSSSKGVINFLCTQLSIGYDLCYSGATVPMIGSNYNIDRTIFQVILGHFPAGCSRKTLIHYSQVGLKTFAWYDYGAKKNLVVYNSITPPIYDLEKFTIDTFFVSGGMDRVSTLKDVEILKSKVPSVKDWKVINEYNHLDHLWASNAHEKEYPYVIEILRKYH